MEHRAHPLRYSRVVRRGSWPNPASRRPTNTGADSIPHAGTRGGLWGRARLRRHDEGIVFDGDLNVAAIAFVYLAGATIGQAAPTPGGLGAVEAALAAGLTAAGLPGGIAVSSVLLFRLITFWIPTIPGYAAFNWLTKKGYL